jgi:hypothetical protein
VAGYQPSPLVDKGRNRPAEFLDRGRELRDLLLAMRARVPGRGDKLRDRAPLVSAGQSRRSIDCDMAVLQIA